MTPKISVLMPVFNGSPYLGEAIRSILGQSFGDFEFLIINDGSTDDSAAIIRGFADPRIRFIDNPVNAGLVKTLNAGLEEARGEYIARMDQDDISMPERLAVQFDYLETNRDVFLLGSPAWIIDEEGRVIKKSRIFPGREVSSVLPVQNCLVHPSIMFRANPKKLYRERMLFCEDYDLYLRLLSEGMTLKNLDRPLLRYRISSHSISRTKALLQRRLAAKAREFYFQRRESGIDRYEEFDRDRFSSETRRMPERLLIGAEIASCLSIGKTREARRLCVRRLMSVRSPKIWAYYIASFLGSRAAKYLFN